MLYGLTGLMEYLVDGRLGNILGSRRMRGKFAKLMNHRGIWSGGREVACMLHVKGMPFLVIEREPAVVARATSES